VYLRALPNLTHLALSNRRVGDVGAAHLAGLRTLRHLELASSQITSEGLKHLSGLIDFAQPNPASALPLGPPG
jgi:hypothetical protein